MHVHIIVSILFSFVSDYDQLLPNSIKENNKLVRALCKSMECIHEDYLGNFVQLSTHD